METEYTPVHMQLNAQTSTSSTLLAVSQPVVVPPVHKQPTQNIPPLPSTFSSPPRLYHQHNDKPDDRYNSSQGNVRARSRRWDVGG